MVRRVPDWTINTAWAATGLFATGALWYYLGQKDYVGAALSIGGAVVFGVLAILLHVARDSSSRKLQDKLASFLQEAQQLRQRLHELPLPIQDHNDWVDRVGQYLRQNLGEAYEVKFSDFSGMVFYGDGSERSQMSRSVDGRSCRLNEFISEFGG
jgi:hypothetical protein